MALRARINSKLIETFPRSLGRRPAAGRPAASSGSWQSGMGYGMEAGRLIDVNWWPVPIAARGAWPSSDEHRGRATWAPLSVAPMTPRSGQGANWISSSLTLPSEASLNLSPQSRRIGDQFMSPLGGSAHLSAAQSRSMGGSRWLPMAPSRLQEAPPAAGPQPVVGAREGEQTLPPPAGGPN